MAVVLVTRAMPEANETAADLLRLGHAPILAPLRLVEFEVTPFPVERPHGLIATSRNALVHGEPIPPDWLMLPIFCVGEKTADAARSLGFGTIRFAGGDAASLLEIIRTEVFSESRLIYLAGEPRSGELESALRSDGIRVEALLRYRMQRVANLPDAARSVLADTSADGVLHFSVESARAFFALVQSAGLLDAAVTLKHGCLSPSVADAASEAAGRPLDFFVAPERSSRSLVAALHGEFI